LSLEEVRKDCPLVKKRQIKQKIMALSKPMKPTYSNPVPSGWTEGGTMPGGGDFHCWVENDAGTVVFDPHFSSYNMVCDLRGLDINKPVYKTWPNQTKWVKKKGKDQQLWLALLHNKTPKQTLKIMKTKVISRGMGGMSFMTNKTMSDWYNNPMDHMCPHNAWAWYLNQTLIKHRSDLHIRVGSMGWRTIKDDSKVFYEFG
jgi:hypothetical protein